MRNDPRSVFEILSELLGSRKKARDLMLELEGRGLRIEKVPALVAAPPTQSAEDVLWSTQSAEDVLWSTQSAEDVLWPALDP